MIRYSVIAGIVILILIFGIKLLNRPAIKENVKNRSYRRIKGLIILGIIGAALYLVFNSTKMYMDGGGRSSVPESVAEAVDFLDHLVELEPGSEIVIRIKKNTVSIAGITYHNIESVRGKIIEYQDKGYSFKLVDEYADSRTYIDVEKVLEECGVSKEFIGREEVE